MYALLLAFVLSTPPARAEANAKQFIGQYERSSEEGRKYLVGYVNGLVTAYRWGNMALKAKDQAPLFCVSATLEMDEDDVLKLVRFQMADDPRIGDTPIGMAVLTTLIRRFPCSTKKKESDSTDETSEFPSE